MFLLGLAACSGEGRCDIGTCSAPTTHACRGDEDCFQTEFCDFERNSCGTSELDEGACRRRPPSFESCEFDGVGGGLACGCDGVYHANQCAANQAGTDIDIGGNCALPPGAFSCGSEACMKDRHVCFELENGNGSSSTFECQQIPDPCKRTPTCACVRQFVGCGECTETNGELRLACDFGMPVPEGDPTSSAAAPRASTSASR